MSRRIVTRWDAIKFMASIGYPGLERKTCDKKRLFRQAAMQFHPDRGGDVEIMKRINEAKKAMRA